jgi:hypothetical protein
MPCCVLHDLLQCFQPPAQAPYISGSRITPFYGARFRSLIEAKSDPAKCILYAPALVAAAVLSKTLEILAQSAFLLWCRGLLDVASEEAALLSGLDHAVSTRRGHHHLPKPPEPRAASAPRGMATDLRRFNEARRS